MKLFLIFALINSVLASLHFYLEPKESQCFLKQLPKDSILFVQYQIEASKDRGASYQTDTEANLNVIFSVEEIFDNNHKVSNQHGQNGRFIFTALDSGEHRICLTPTTTGGYQLPVKSKLTIDLETGDKSILEGPGDNERLRKDLQLRKLYRNLNFVKMQYLMFRDREARFRDLSEIVNSSAIRWIFLQFIVLGLICYFQLRSLKTFFIKEKVF
ncbi:hypothetical protein FOA43_001409 [Brettanomyces nanus]|uniref:GOLD domain-containing protein n=1 Tax=Eeniella nana TaxID=13502 RepID=A0A875RZD6_EENNA|nr:uncharacterized protein FOA43_001409 [Brettanomyces nanus]QPG74088.1 hypothetical protein FOA43_001409 [Brettanomyces nanus]